MGSQIEILFPLAEIDDPPSRAWFVDGGANQSYGPGPTAGTLAPGASPHQIASDTNAPANANASGNPLIGDAGYYYFEVTVLDTGFEHTPCIGIAGSTFQVQDPIGIDRHVYEATLANGLFWPLGASIGFGWPSGPNNVSHVVDGTVVSVAVDTVHHLVWARNVTNGDPWIGDLPGGGDPTTLVNGFSFATGSPITGNIYILGGAGWDSTAGFAIPPGLPAMMSLNASGPFAGTLPTGYKAWDTTGTPTLFDPATKAIELEITAGLTIGLSSRPTGPTGNQGTDFALSNTSKKQA